MAGSRVRWHRLVDGEQLRDQARERILAAAASAIDARGRFTIVLAGGGTPRPVYRALRTADADWNAWQIYFGDERCLPEHDPERNSAMARAAWLDHVPLPPASIHVIPAEHGAGPGASAYAETLRDVGTFDLVLLGLGEDGHTASLFPGRDWGQSADAPAAIAVHDAPKPPSDRVSLSAARLSEAHQVIFMIEEVGKRDAVRAWQAGKPIPAAAIRPPGGVDVLLQTDPGSR